MIRLWRRADTLGIRLFMAMALANVIVAIGAWAATGWSFDRSLADYLVQSDGERLAPLVQRLGEGWRRERSWRWIAEDHEQWHALLREELGLAVGGGARPPRREGDDVRSGSRREVDEGRGSGRRESDEARSRRGRGFGEGRLLLLDADRRPIEGPSEHLEEAVLLPIEVDGQRVGWLGRLPRRDMMVSIERAFASRQARQFAWIAGGAALAMLLASALAARWLARRLAPLGHAATQVARGDYGVRLPVRGHDELAQLAGDFNHMAAALAAAQRARQQWVADIAHELRTPLTTLRAEVEALQDGVRAPTPDRLASLAQEVMRLTRLVEDLRLLSLSDIGALEIRRSPLDLGAWLDDWLDGQRSQCPPDLRLERQIAQGLTLPLDASRLAQVCANLWQNTLRYADRPARLRVSLARDGARIVWIWEDSAPGVPAELLPRLTDRLYRVDASRTRAGEAGGSGLGLAIVKAIVEAHGGTLEPSASPLGGLRWTLVFTPPEATR